MTDVSFVRREARPQVEVYCDESGLERFAAPSGPHDRALFGGIWLEARHRRELKAAIRAHREQHRVASEFKWNKVSPSRLEFYLGLVDLFFESSAHFRAIVLPVGQLETGRHHGGDAELMFYKFYYQLLHHWIFPGVRYRIFVDQKTDRVRSRVRNARGRVGGLAAGQRRHVRPRRKHRGVRVVNFVGHAPAQTDDDICVRAFASAL